MKPNLFKYAVTFLAVAGFIAPDLTLAKDNIVILDGRKILLKDDGDWEYVSKDRYANTQDGRQVILKENGKWEYVNKNEAIKMAPAPTPYANPDIPVMQLQKGVVESIIKKQGKGASIKTQSVIYIDINIPSNAQTTFMLGNHDKNNITVTDDKDNRYKVLAVQPEISLKPGETGTIQIRVDGSPSILDYVTYMYVHFTPAINGIAKPMTVKAKWKDFIQKSVDEFKY